VAKVAASSEAHVADAAREALRTGNAVDAVIAGVFVAAAESPGVLLGPLQMLAGGAGSGLFAIDGRVRQPGRSVPRPRGFLPEDRVPAAARVGVPGLPGALAAAAGLLGTMTLRRAVQPAIGWVRTRHPERAPLFEALARRGAPGLVDDAVAAELTGVAGRASGGLLTREDLESVRPAVVRCAERSLAPSGLLTPPWLGHVSQDASSTHIVAAGDARGLMAIACYEAKDEGLPMPGLGVVAPLYAAPVMRGETRVAPGTPRPAAAPIVLRLRRNDVDAALGLAAATDAEQMLRAVLSSLDLTLSLGEVFRAVPRGFPVGIVLAHGGPKVIGSA
jgi:gamma-glutamyltranspeptidase/glutathione hydrolase